MTNNYIEMEIVVHPVHGMQLSEGYIRQDGFSGFVGSLPGLALLKKARHAGRGSGAVGGCFQGILWRRCCG